MTNLEAGRFVIDTFLNSYSKVNGVILTRAQLFSVIYPKYSPDIIMKEFGSNFLIALNGQRSELIPLMDVLAQKTKGGYPSVQAFRDIFLDQIPSKFEIITKALTESAGDISNGLVAIGNSAITAGTWLTTLFPYIAIGVVGYFLYTNRNKLELGFDLKDVKLGLKK